MAQIQRQSAKSALYIYLGAALGLGSNILFGNYLTASENGVLALLASFGALLGVLSNLGFSFAGIRFFPEMRNEETHHGGYLRASIKYGCIAFVLVSVFFLLLKHQIIGTNDKAFDKYYTLTLVIAFGNMLYNALSDYMRFNFNSTTPTLAKEFIQRFLILFFFMPNIFGWFSFDTYVIFYVLIFMLIPIALVWYIKKKGYWLFGNYFGKQTLLFRKKFWKACAYGFITGLGGGVLLYLDSIMVNSILDTAQTGIYVRNFYFATIVVMASRALIGISQTHISEAFNTNNLKKVDEIYYKSCLTQTIIGMLFFIGVWGNIDNIYRIIPLEYEAGKYVILYVGLGNLFNMITGSNSLVIGASPHYKMNTYSIFLLLVLAVLFNLWLIPIYGITGAAIATAISGSVVNVFRSVFIYKKYGFQPYNKRYILLFILAIISLGLGFVIPEIDNLFVDVLIRSAVLGGFFIIPVYRLKVSQDINSLIDKMLYALLARLK